MCEFHVNFLYKWFKDDMAYKKKIWEVPVV